MTKHIRELAPSRIENVTRRGVLKGILSTTGLVLAVSILPHRPALAADAPKWGAAGMPHGTVNNPLAFVSIAPDGAVTIVCHRSEMGQGVRTGMPLIVADEIEADWAKVKIAQATGDEAKYGNQDTDGSRSTRHFMTPMRQCGAAARMMLEAGRGQALGRRRFPMSRRGTTRSCRNRPARRSALASLPPTPARWTSRPPTSCVSRTRRSSATSARKAPISSTDSTSRRVAPNTARTSACRA